VPLLLTRPIRPRLVMSAGMMPALDWPGLMTPGQLGPMIRVRLPFAQAYAQNVAVSWTGMPSVRTTARLSSASMASTTAAFANRGGTKRTDTSAAVARTASMALSKTGIETPASPSTVWPPLPGVTPATMFVPAAIMRRVCLVPSAPVMPWTSTLLFSVRKIAMALMPLWRRVRRRVRRRGAPRCPSCLRCVRR